MLKRLAVVLCAVFAIMPLTANVGHAGTTCNFVTTVGTKLGIFPLGMHQEEAEQAWRDLCAATP